MWNSILMVIVFLLTLFLEQSVFVNFPPIYQFLPLGFMVGVLLAQKTNHVFGSIWFIALFIAALLNPFSAYHPISYLLIAVLLPIALAKLFSNRSVYALIGTGATLYLAMILIDIFARYVLQGLGRSFFLPFSEYIQITGGIFLLLPLLFFALFGISRLFTQLFSRYFYLRV